MSLVVSGRLRDAAIARGENFSLEMPDRKENTTTDKLWLLLQSQWNYICWKQLKSDNIPLKQMKPYMCRSQRTYNWCKTFDNRPCVLKRHHPLSDQSHRISCSSDSAFPPPLQPKAFINSSRSWLNPSICAGLDCQAVQWTPQKASALKSAMSLQSIYCSQIGIQRQLAMRGSPVGINVF